MGALINARCPRLKHGIYPQNKASIPAVEIEVR